DDEGAVLARAPGFEEALLVVDVEPAEVIGRRLRDVRRRALAREREDIPPVEIIHVGARGPSGNGSKATGEVGPFVDELEQMPIGAVVDAFDSALSKAFAGTEPDLAEENIQARARGVVLMALSNKFGWMLVATGNKSELSVGYATLYGDMAGGFALLKDVYKT